MKFGKLSDISQVDFSLPVVPKSTHELLIKLPKTEQPALYVGCTGWSMKEWVGRVYPFSAKTKDFLKYYTQQFNTIELNTTHYRIPDFDTVRKWRMQAVFDFRFCPKIPQSISHSRDMGLTDGKLLAFCEAIQSLEEKLGCCFIQMPPYFKSSQLTILEIFLEKFPNHIPLAVEVRHESWFNNKKVTENLADLLRQKNRAFVITDVAGRRDVLHLNITCQTAMIRFVGNALHPSDYTRINQWIKQLKNWFEKGLKEVFFFTHEPENLQAPEMAKYLVEQALKQIPNIRVRGPEFIKKQSEQMRLF